MLLYFTTSQPARPPLGLSKRIHESKVPIHNLPPHPPTIVRPAGRKALLRRKSLRLWLLCSLLRRAPRALVEDLGQLPRLEERGDDVAPACVDQFVMELSLWVVVTGGRSRSCKSHDSQPIKTKP